MAQLLNTERTNMPEAQIVSKLLHKGGKVLVIGGGLNDLPDKYKKNAQILIWDDDRQGIQTKEVPTNTRAIIYNRWVSHKTRDKIDVACKQLHIIKIPMLKTREIKILLDEVINESITKEPVTELVTESITEPVTEQETIMSRSGVRVKDFIAKHLDYSKNYKVKGTISSEGERIFKIAKDEGIQTTLNSVKQVIGQAVGKQKPRKTSEKITKPTVVTDQFAELEQLVSEALSAITLIQEQISKIRSTENVRFQQSMKDKLLSMLES